MLKETIQIPNGDFLMDYDIYECDCCGEEIEEAHPHYFEKTNTHICGDCAFINGFIDEKTFLRWNGIDLDSARAAVKDGKIYVVLYGKFDWEKKKQDDRFNSRYKEWRKACFERDKFTCQKCGIVGKRLNAHHIKPYAKYKELRYDINNGITLCENCHKTVHKGDKIMEYFKHDINASEDDKICEMLANEGYEFLGYYWRFVEYLYSRGGKIDKNKLNSVAWSLHMDIDKLSKMICNYGLFLEDKEFIYSKRISSEIEEFEEVGKRMAELGRKGGQARAKAMAKADVQQNKENKKNKQKEENKNKYTPNGADALSGKLPDGYSIHENSGEVYTVIDGKMYNLNGDELNSAGFVIIDFGLSKHNL